MASWVFRKQECAPDDASEMLGEEPRPSAALKQLAGDVSVRFSGAAKASGP